MSPEHPAFDLTSYLNIDEKTMHRRQFIRSGSALGVSLAMTQPWDRVLGANDDIRGSGRFQESGEKSHHWLGNLPGVRLTAL